MKTPCFVANWKMHKTRSEAVDYLETLQKRLPPACMKKAQIILAPPYTALVPMFEWTQTASFAIDFAAQNIHSQKNGAYTGEVSAAMIYDTGCRYVLVGHSERRNYFHETDSEIAKKVAHAGETHLIPILCVGETLKQWEENKTRTVVTHQVQQGLGKACSEHRTSCIIAYEPVWAIGTGKTPIPEEVEQVHEEIGRYIQSEGVLEDRPRILYGGSVNEKNVAAFMKEPHIDGVLVGGASLSAELFAEMIECGLRAKEVF